MESFIGIVRKFSGKKIVVIGDIILDEYWIGNVDRISPEAPVPVVHIKDKHSSLGGAGNVAGNIVSMGGKAHLFGFIGNDSKGERVRILAQQKGIYFSYSYCGKTPHKLRISGKKQQLIRLDDEDLLEKKFDEKILEELNERCKEADFIIISDYAKGTISAELMKSLWKFRNKIIVDPKPKNIDLYRGVFMIKSNEKESREMSEKKEISEIGKDLRERLDSKIIITRGGRGMSIFSEKIIEIPTYAKEVFDVTGAGDSVIACMALCLSCGSTIEEASTIANHAAAITVGKFGSYCVKKGELENELIGSEKKIMKFDILLEKVNEERKKERKIVWTNGVFDLLHIGHINYLKEAKKIGDILVVGINSDLSTKKLKGENRPVQNERDRAEIISSLEFVDYVVIFEETSVEKYLKELKPDYFVKGGDYNVDNMNQDERKAVETYMGNFFFVPIVKDNSTSKIIDKIGEK